MAYLLSSADIADLVDKIKTCGDESIAGDAMDDLYCALSPMLLRYLGSTTYIEEHTLEDVVQGAFMSAWLKIDTLKDNEKFLSWLISIAKHELFHFLNKQKKLRKIEQELAVIYAHESYDDIQDVDGVSSLLSILPEIDKDIVLRKCVFEYSFEDIATAYKMKESRIKMRYYRALEKMRTHHDIES